MKTNYLINNVVIFYPEEHRLMPLDNKGVETSLNIPASRCLLLLIERKNSVVSKKEFYEQAWEQHGTYVTANTFYQNISLLRKGLKSAGISEELIRTVPKKGLTLSDEVTITPLSEENAITAVTSMAKEEVAQDKEQIASAPKETKNTRFINRLCVTATVLFLCAVAVFLYDFRAESQYFAGYKLDDTVNNCNLYLPNKEREPEKYIDFIKSNNISCNAKQELFMTMNRASEFISVIKCDGNINSKDSECDSEYYSRRMNEK